MGESSPPGAPARRRMDDYLAQLPDGLDSFPDCRAKASVHRRVVGFSQHALLDLPTPLQQLVDSPPPANTWIPQCHSLALLIAAVESQQLEGSAECAWVRRAADQVFNTPMYRILMWAGTPRLLFKGAHLRWSAFFRGSSLSATLESTTAALVLDSPRELFTEDLANIFEGVLSAAANFIEDGQGSIQLEHFRPGAVVYRGSW